MVLLVKEELVESILVMVITLEGEVEAATTEVEAEDPIILVSHLQPEEAVAVEDQV
jgi:hypothetical protein